MSGFFNDYYKSVSPISKITAKVFIECGDNICCFLTIYDILKLSVLSRFSAGLPLSSDVANRLIRINNRISMIGNLSVQLSPDPLTIGMFRRILNRLATNPIAELSV